MGPWFCYNPWAPQGLPPVQQGWRPNILGAPPQAHVAFTPMQPPTTFALLHVSQPAPLSNQAGLIAALNQMNIQEQPPWLLDSGASSHMLSLDGILLFAILPLIPSLPLAMVKPFPLHVVASLPFKPLCQIFILIMF
jgi:hypothetical protein